MVGMLKFCLTFLPNKSFCILEAAPPLPPPRFLKVEEYKRRVSVFSFFRWLMLRSKAELTLKNSDVTLSSNTLETTESY